MTVLKDVLPPGFDPDDLPEQPAEAVAGDPHDVFLGTRHFSALNGIRALCCLAVIKEHVNWSFQAARLFDHGWLGVDLFFTISGFLIVTLLIRERERRGVISLGKFYARRTLRIFPIYYLMIFSVIGVYLAVSPWRPNGLRYYLIPLPYLLTYTQDLFLLGLGGFFHCWSLAMEEQFYLFWPAVERYVFGPARWFLLGGLILANQGVNFGLFDGLILRIYGDPAALKLPLYMITFTPILLGVLLAYLLHSRGTFRILYRLVGWRWSPLLWAALLFVAAELTPDLTRGIGRLLVHLDLMLLLGSLVIREDHIARPILTTPLLARLGVTSYGIYLYHVWVISVIGTVLQAVRLPDLNPPTLFPIVTVLTVALAEASFRFIELPLLRIKERFHS